jgi:hypothetical protein
LALNFSREQNIFYTGVCFSPNSGNFLAILSFSVWQGRRDEYTHCPGKEPTVWFLLSCTFQEKGEVMRIARKTVIALVAVAFSIGMVVSAHASGAEATAEKAAGHAADSANVVKEAAGEVVENAKDKAVAVVKEEANKAVDAATDKATSALTGGMEKAADSATETAAEAAKEAAK